MYASARRSFQEARELLARVKSARGYFLVVGTGAFDGLAQPSTDREPAKSRGKGKKGKRKGKSFSQKSGKPTSLGTPGILPKPRNSRVESRLPMSRKRPTEAGATRGGPHHAPRLRPDQCMLCRQVGHRASECPNKGRATAFSPGKRPFGTYVLGCAVFDSPCYGATAEEIEQDQDEEDIEGMIFFIHPCSYFLLFCQQSKTQSPALVCDRAAAGSDPVHTGLPPIRGLFGKTFHVLPLLQHRTPGLTPRTRAP